MECGISGLEAEETTEEKLSMSMTEMENLATCIVNSGIVGRGGGIPCDRFVNGNKNRVLYENLVGPNNTIVVLDIPDNVNTTYVKKYYFNSETYAKKVLEYNIYDAHLVTRDLISYYIISGKESAEKKEFIKTSKELHDIVFGKLDIPVTMEDLNKYIDEKRFVYYELVRITDNETVVSYIKDSNLNLYEIRVSDIRY